MRKILGIITLAFLAIGANTSQVKKGANSTLAVSDRDGSSLIVRGSQYPMVVSSTNLTIGDTDFYDTVYITTGASNRTITLPSARKANGRKIRVVKIDSGVGCILMAASFGSVIGAVPKVCSINGSMQFECDSNNWYMTQLHDEGTFTATLGNVSVGATATWRYARVGSNVSIYNNGNASAGNYYWPFTKNGASGVVTISGLPASIITTATDTWLFFQLSYNNGGSPATFNNASGLMDSTGVISLYRDIGADPFGASTQNHLVTGTFSYPIQ